MKNNSLIKILDCTLRDGGYVNNWEFSLESTKAIITALIDSNIEIVECGFVNQKYKNTSDSTVFSEINQVNELLLSLDRDIESTDFCVMVNKGDLDIDSLPSHNKKTGPVSMIRYAFHKKDWREALDDTKIMIKKGYQVYVQAMVTLSYSDDELLEMLTEVNKYDVYAMYIVDSFGAMFGDDFRRLNYLFENNLKKNIRLGYHSHNNLQLAFSNAIDFIQIKDSEREIIIDSSIQGMGRGAGNLTTELLATFLNKKKNTEYNTVPLLETIDKYLGPIYKENYWGYTIAHFLSASFNCHPNYSSFLVNKKNLLIVDIQKILGLLDNGEKKNFNKDRIEELYLNFKSNLGLPINFNVDFFKDQNILIIAPGPNAIKQKETVEKFINAKKPLVIAVNHIPKNFNSNYFFFSNQKRFDKFIEQIEPNKAIITTNIHVNSNSSNYKVVDYNNLATKTSNKNDNVTILLLNLLINQKVKEVYLAGFDGYKFDSGNYSYTEHDRIIEKKVIKHQNENIIVSLKEIRKNLSMNFITESIYK